MPQLHPCEGVIGPVHPWLSNVINAAQVRGLKREDLVKRQIDHFCFRCQTKQEYVDIRTRLTSDNIGELMVESMIGGRYPASTTLSQPLSNFSSMTLPLTSLLNKSRPSHFNCAIGQSIHF